jgi:Tfp pilus assembly protein PilP
MSKPIKLICGSLLLLLCGCSSTADKEKEDLKRELLEVRSETSVLKGELNSLKNMAPPVKSAEKKEDAATTSSGTLVETNKGSPEPKSSR